MKLLSRGVMEAMSSFRIDRQYVSFEAAEIHPIGFSGYKLRESSADVQSPTPFNVEETEKQRQEIIRKAQKEAYEKSQLMLDRARAEAEEVVKKARLLAEEIIAEAEANGKEIKERAEKKGYSQGLKTAEDSANLIKSEEEIELQRMMDKLRGDYSKLVESLHGDVVSLSLEIVKKIIGIKLDSTDEIFIDLVKDAIGRLKQTGFITIHVGSDDYARYFGDELPEKYLNTGSAKIAVIEDEDFLPGDLVVESEGEVLDFSIRKQIEKIEKAFMGESS